MVDQRRASRSRSASRRRLVAGAAWAAPAAVVAASAPAFAVSQCESVPAMSAANGWTVANTNMSATGGGNGFAAPSGYSLVANPASNALATVRVTSPPRTFVVGRTYTYSFAYTAVGTNPRQLQMSLSAAGVVLPGAALNSDTTVPLIGTRSVSFTPTVTGSGTVEVLFTFPTGTSTVGDDITITNFTATCS